jgi:hypothetical protein
MENLMQVLDRAKARHEEHERAINASATLRDEFALAAATNVRRSTKATGR